MQTFSFSWKRGNNVAILGLQHHKETAGEVALLDETHIPVYHGSHHSLLPYVTEWT